MARKSRLSSEKIQNLITHFVAGTPARSASLLCETSRETATRWYYTFHNIIATHLEEMYCVLDGEVEMDESCFGGKRKRKNENEKEEEVLLGKFRSLTFSKEMGTYMQ